MDVKEIQHELEIRPIPNAPPYIEGISNLRGSIVPIINLHQRFHFKKASLNEDDESLSGIIIIEINRLLLGVIIDKVSRVVTISGNMVQPPPQMISGIGTEYIQGVVKEDEGYLIVLNIRRLFNPQELSQISKIRE